MSPPQVLVVMGVSGSGKTTIGEALARTLGWRFLEGDDLHPKQNREKLASGVALTDEDRAPWLARVREEIVLALRSGTSLVVACSALKERYRRTLAQGDPVRFVLLHGSRELLRERMERRRGHFASPAILDSQLATLEPPADALTLDIADPPESLVQRIVESVQGHDYTSHA